MKSLSVFLLFIILSHQLEIPEGLSFGKSMLQFFDIDPKYININHGSYGSTPSVVT